MARYRGPKNKKARAFGEAIFGDHKRLKDRMYPPGQHGTSKKRKQRSDYANQLQEKQKAKYTYGVLERQFSNLFKKAHAKAGVTGEILLQLLEARLDNVVYRLGLASSRPAARQMVLHRHITLNGIVTNIPSATLRAGDVVAVRGKSLNLDMVTTSVAATKVADHAWLQWNPSKMEGIVLAMPTREQIMENINEQLIVELYSK
jgi:small subunit ribosomal protein S4